MKIVIASGIFFPELGGPATYVANISDEFIKLGHDIKIITYSDKAEYDFDKIFKYPIFRVRRSNKLLNYLKYFLVLYKETKGVDIIYAQDLVSVGLPCALLKLFGRKVKMVVRLGGDFLWERAYNSNWTKQTLDKYYGEPKNFYERIYLIIYSFVLRKFDKIIFSTKWQQDIYVKNFLKNNNKSTVIANAFPSHSFSPEKSSYGGHILFAGRLIKLKNIDRLIEAIKGLVDKKLLIIGDGPEKKNLISLVKKLGIEDRVYFKEAMPFSALSQEILNSHLTIVPSISEVSPNMVLESIKLNKPVLLSKNSGFYVDFKDKLIFIDPLDVEDIKNKIADLFDQDKYRDYLAIIKSINTNRDWHQVSVEHIDVFKKVLL